MRNNNTSIQKLYFCLRICAFFVFCIKKWFLKKKLLSFNGFCFKWKWKDKNKSKKEAFRGLKVKFNSAYIAPTAEFQLIRFQSWCSILNSSPAPSTKRLQWKKETLVLKVASHMYRCTCTKSWLSAILHPEKLHCRRKSHSAMYPMIDWDDFNEACSVCDTINGIRLNGNLGAFRLKFVRRSPGLLASLEVNLINSRWRK